MPVGENGWKPPGGGVGAAQNNGDHRTPDHPAPVGENGWKPPVGATHDHGPDSPVPTLHEDHPTTPLHAAPAHRAPDHGRPEGGHGGRSGGTTGVHRAADTGRIANPHVYTSWGWNSGTEWVPQPHYWGGAFWGPVALGVSVGTYVTVVPDSPGFVLLSNYSLIQAPCDPAGGQVEIYGPDGTIICALPNSLVPQGRYEIDMSTLTLQVTNDE